MENSPRFIGPGSHHRDAMDEAMRAMGVMPRQQQRPAEPRPGSRQTVRDTILPPAALPAASSPATERRTEPEQSLEQPELVTLIGRGSLRKDVVVVDPVSTELEPADDGVQHIYGERIDPEDSDPGALHDVHIPAGSGLSIGDSVFNGPVHIGTVYGGVDHLDDDHRQQ